MARGRKIFCSLEEEVEAVTNEGGLVENGAEIESSITNINEGCNEVVANSDAVEDGMEEVGNLEDIGGVLEESIKDDGVGVSPEAAKIAEIAIERARYKLNIKNKRTMPSLESFGSRQSRIVATKMAIEFNMETIKSGWKKIIEALKKGWEYLLAFFTKIFTGAGRLKSRAESMLKHVQATSSLGELNKKTFKNSTLHDAFTLEKSFSTSNIIKVITNSDDAITAALSFTEACNKSIEKWNALFANGIPDMNVIIEGQSVLRDEAKQIFHTSSNSTPPLVNGDLLIVRFEEAGEGESATLTPILEVSEGFKVTDSGEVELAPLSREAMIATAKDVITLATNITKLSGNRALVTKAIKDLNTLYSCMEKEAKKSETDESKAEAAAFGSIRRAVAATSGISQKFIGRSISLSLTGGNRALDYINKSLGCYGNGKGTGSGTGSGK